MPEADTPYHHGSHQRLLWSHADPGPAGAGPSDPGPADAGLPDPGLAGPGLDAIIVPTARPPAYLAEVGKLASQLQCNLVTLHSGKWTSAAKAVDQLPGDVRLTAIEIPARERLNMPTWETSRLLQGTVFARKSDLSTKRNLALMLSRMLGWSRILFLDDDITGLVPHDMRRASSLLDTYNAVGLHVAGFPDHSVVCHAYRQAGGRQQSFIGGGALAVQARRCISFFPDIYNEDWFFLLDGDKRLQPTAVTGQVVQYPYDPFRTPERARAEELGDLLAEGLYWLLDQDRSIVEADREHWARALDSRRKFIDGVLEMVRADALDEAERARRIAALKGALGRLALITPGLCEKYLAAWQADRASWHRHIELLPTRMQIGPAIAALSRKGMAALTWKTGPGLSAGAAFQASATRTAAAAAAEVPLAAQVR